MKCSGEILGREKNRTEKNENREHNRAVENGDENNSGNMREWS